jgi:hypothetical protein
MKTEVVKSVVVKFDKDEKELIKKVIFLINDLMSAGFQNNCDGFYEINGISHDTGELEDFVEYLKDLAYSDVIELT